MRKIMLLLILVVSINLFANNIYVVNSTSGTLSKVNYETGSVDNAYVDLGVTPNLIDIKDDIAYVTNSGDNSVQKIDLITGNTLSNIYVGDSSNPWHARVKDDYLYVTGFVTNKLYKIDLISEEVVSEIEVGQAPESIEFAQGKIYVACSGGYANNYQDSKITVLSEENMQIITTIPTSLNPQNLHYYRGKIYVMCTGNWSDILGVVEVINPENDTIISSLDIGGNIGKAAFINNHGYITDAMNAGVYLIDTDNDTVINDSTNPLSPGASTIATNGQSIAFVNSVWGANGSLWLTDDNLGSGQTFELALAPTDVIFQYQAVANVDNNVELAPITVSTYPNPCSQKLNFSLQGNTRGASKIQIYNLKGQLVDEFSSSDNQFSWKNKTKSINSLANGIYFYKITNNKQSISGKFMILK